MKKATIPKDAKRVALRPLALGEVSGHHHSLVMDPASSVALKDAVELFEVTDDSGVQTYLRVTGEGVSIQHQEHKTSPVAPGDYKVTIQQEETDWGSARVQD